MSTPYNPRREVFDIDRMLAAGNDMLDVDALLQKMLGAQEGLGYRPKAQDLKDFWMLWHSPNGRKLMEWWLDMTLRAPYPHVGDDVQSAALAAARFQARASLGEVLLEALSAGKKVYEQGK